MYESSQRACLCLVGLKRPILVEMAANGRGNKPVSRDKICMKRVFMAGQPIEEKIWGFLTLEVSFLTSVSFSEGVVEGRLPT